MKWQPIETMPTRSWCLVWSNRYGVELAVRTESIGIEVRDTQCGGMIAVDYPTHWQPLPEPPEQENK